MKWFASVKKLFIRELRLVSKDINIISVILLAPLFYSFFYGSIYFNKVETDVEIVVMDMDNSAISNKIIRLLDSHQSIKVNGKINDLEEGNKKLISEEAKAIIYFPNGFEKELKKGKRTEVKIYLNGTRFLVSNDLNKAINKVVGYVNAGITLKYYKAKGLNHDQAKEVFQPIRLDIRPLFNFTDSYGDFLIPAVLVLILQQTLLIGLSESIAKDREKNLFNKLGRLANWNPNILIHGKGFFYFFLFGSYGFFFFTVNFSVFKIPNRGDFFPLFIITALLILSVIYNSIFISSFFHRKIVSLQFLTLTSYPVFLLSGYSWLYESLPLYLKFVTNLIPSTPYFAAYTRITLMGAGLSDIIPELVHLLILTIAGYTVSYYRVNKLIKPKQQNKYLPKQRLITN